MTDDECTDGTEQDVGGVLDHLLDDDVREWRVETAKEIGEMDTELPDFLESIIKTKLRIERDLTAIKLQNERSVETDTE